jgi:hypothetical protein
MYLFFFLENQEKKVKTKDRFAISKFYTYFYNINSQNPESAFENFPNNRQFCPAGTPPILFYKL